MIKCKSTYFFLLVLYYWVIITDILTHKHYFNVVVSRGGANFNYFYYFWAVYPVKILIMFLNLNLKSSR